MVLRPELEYSTRPAVGVSGPTAPIPHPSSPTFALGASAGHGTTPPPYAATTTTSSTDANNTDANKRSRSCSEDSSPICELFGEVQGAKVRDEDGTAPVARVGAVPSEDDLDAIARRVGEMMDRLMLTVDAPFLGETGLEERRKTVEKWRDR